MCQNAQKTAIALLSEIEPTIIALGNEAGISSSPAFQTALKEYDAAVDAVKNWKSGTPAQDAIEAINILEGALQLLPLPPGLGTLLNIILAGVATVIGVLSANSPAPLPVTPTPVPAAEAETQAQHQTEVIHETTVKVKQLVPGFKRSIFTPPATQYRNTWNNAVHAGGFHRSLLVA